MNAILSRLRKTLFITLFILSPTLFYAEEGNKELSSHHEKTEVIEQFLQNTVPGLEVSYRDVFNACIAEGHDIYIKGGLIRDLLSPYKQTPHDLDFMFTGSKEQIIKILQKHHWKYTVSPGYSIIVIGDRDGVFTEGTPYKLFFAENEFQKEFTVNNIYYHVNTKKFVFDSADGLEDLESYRLNIKSENWEQWLYGSPGYYKYAKLFRVWKMVGKGYIHQTRLEDFIREQTFLAQSSNEQLFLAELLEYLSNHVEAYDDIANGCKAIMGQEWFHKNMESLFKNKDSYYTE